MNMMQPHIQHIQQETRAGNNNVVSLFIYIKKNDQVSIRFQVNPSSQPSFGSTGFRWVNSQTGFYLDLDRSWVDPPGQSGFKKYA